MSEIVKIDPNKVSPSQAFLKARTVHIIFDCIKSGKLDALPPIPIVRRDNDGNYVAIDGHNLLAVKAFLGLKQEVHVASSPSDGLPAISEQNMQRNADLFAKFDSCLVDRDASREQGVASFKDLINQNSELFAERINRE